MRKPSKRRNSDAGCGSPQPLQSKNVGIDTLDLDQDFSTDGCEQRRRRHYRSHLPAEVRSEIARHNQRARIPTDPHPDNVALVGPRQPFDGYPSVFEWVKSYADEMRQRKATSGTGFVAWIASETLADRIERQLEDLARHPDRPIRAKTIRQLRRVLAMMKADLLQTRPF